MEARCVRCRGRLNGEGLCPGCDADEVAVASRLRELREEIARERGDAPPARPRSRLWRRTREKLSGTGETKTDTPPPDDSPASGETADSGPPDENAESGSAGDPTSSPEPADPTPSGSEPSPSRVHRSGRSASLRARELDVTDPRHGSDAVRELLEHRRRGRGRIVGIAGLPRHGKTKLADRLRERYAERPGADLRYDKTERGEVNLYYIPGRREHHVLVDVAGEDFQALGDYERELPALVRRFLWPVLQELDGLVLLMALPIVWAGWNDPHSERRAEPSEADEIAMRRARDRMVNAHRMLLKYAIVARDLKRLRRVAPGVGLQADEVPTRSQVDDAVPSARPLSIPVALAFSKADLYAPGDGAASSSQGLRTVGLHTPDLPGRKGEPAPPVHPLHTDPLVLGRLHFPVLHDFLVERVRYFHFDFVQALVDRSDAPDPHEAPDGADAGRGTLVGGEALLEFVTRHPWGVPGLDAAAALRVDRALDPRRWGRELLRRLYGREGGVR